jgi:hypothetical protein
LDINSVSSALGLLSQFGSNAPALSPGQVIEAVVLALLEDGSVRLALPNATLDVRSTIPLTAGTSVRLLVKSTASGLQLVVSPESTARDSTTAAISGGLGQTPDMVTASDAVAIEGPAVNTTMATSVEEQAVDLSAQGPNATTQATMAQRPAPSQAGGAVAIATAVRSAAARQGGLAPLMADIEQLVGGETIEAPTAVLKAAAQLLALRLPLQGDLTAGDIKQALSQSGLFLEARLAGPESEIEGPPSLIGRPGAAAPQANPPAASTTTASPSDGANVPWSAPALASPVTDLKAALLVLRQVVQLWADQADDAPNAPSTATGNMSPPVPAAAAPAGGSPLAAPEAALASLLGAATTEPAVAMGRAAAIEPDTRLPAAAGEAATEAADGAVSAPPDAPMSPPPPPPPPPYRGSPPVAQPATAATLASASSPSDAAQQLLGATDAALARHTLLQAASLPDRPNADPARVQTQGPQWAFEVPVMTSAGTSIAQFEISRDGQAATSDGRAIWRARFSVDVEPMGPVHAQVTLLGNRATVMLWAERPHSAARLREGSALLAEALRQAELEPGDIHCRTGAPTVPRESVPAAGQFLDRAS